MDFSQLLADLLPMREPPRWEVEIVTDSAIVTSLHSTPLPGEAVDEQYAELLRDDKLVAINVRESALWVKWRRAMNEQLAEAQLRG